MEDIENRTILEASCECEGYFYFLKTLRYGNIVAGYELKIAKAENKKFIVKESKTTSKNQDEAPVVRSRKIVPTISMTSLTKNVGVNDLIADSILFYNYFNEHTAKSTFNDFTGIITFELHFNYGSLKEVKFRQENIPQEIKDEIEQLLLGVKQYQIKKMNLEKEKHFTVVFNLIRKYNKAKISE